MQAFHAPPNGGTAYALTRCRLPTAAVAQVYSTALHGACATTARVSAPSPRQSGALEFSLMKGLPLSATCRFSFRPEFAFLLSLLGLAQGSSGTRSTPLRCMALAPPLPLPPHTPAGKAAFVGQLAALATPARPRSLYVSFIF